MKKAFPFLFVGAVVISSTVISDQSLKYGFNVPAIAVPAAPATGGSSTAPTRPVPERTNTAPTGTTTIAAAGTTLNTDLLQDISTGKARNNERFTLRVKTGWFGGNSALKDAQINGHLEQVVKAARGKKASLNLVFDNIVLKNGDAYPIDAELVNTQVETKRQGQFVKNTGIILGGVVAGRFLGNRSNFKHGGLAGGTAAAAYVLSSPGGEVVLKKETDIKLKLRSPLNIVP